MWGLDLHPDQILALNLFAETLGDYKEANVIGTKSVTRILEDHVLDSLSCMLFPGIRAAKSLVDVGSGAGLPGIPLKLALPDLRVDLLEATAKKSRFEELAINVLGVEKARVLNARAEMVGRDTGYRGRYDLATARALSSLATVSEYCVPLLKVGGHGIAMKASLDEKEVLEGRRAAHFLGARISEIIEVPLLTEIRARERRLVIVEKIRETPDLYPRKSADIKKRPLGRES